MSVVRIIIDTRFEKQNRTYPIKLRLNHGSQAYIALDINIKKDQWEDEQVVNYPKYKLCKYEQRKKKKEKTGKNSRGREPKAPSDEPNDKDPIPSPE